MSVIKSSSFHRHTHTNLSLFQVLNNFWQFIQRTPCCAEVPARWVQLHAFSVQGLFGKNSEQLTNISSGLELEGSVGGRTSWKSHVTSVLGWGNWSPEGKPSVWPSPANAVKWTPVPTCPWAADSLGVCFQESCRNELPPFFVFINYFKL